MVLGIDRRFVWASFGLTDCWDYKEGAPHTHIYISYGVKSSISIPSKEVVSPPVEIYLNMSENFVEFQVFTKSKFVNFEHYA